jgi:hypothetical protein
MKREDILDVYVLSNASLNVTFNFKLLNSFRYNVKSIIFLIRFKVPDCFFHLLFHILVIFLKSFSIEKKPGTPPSQNVKNFGFDLWKNLRSKPTEDF